MNDLICNTCGKEFGNKTALSWHEEGVHGRSQLRSTAPRLVRIGWLVSAAVKQASTIAPLRPV